jgi:predicted DNA-binding WGR domain protein
MAKRYFEFKDDKSNKFWEVELNGKELNLRWGKCGSDGQSQVKTFDSEASAQKEHDKLVAEKTKKGYKEGGAVETITDEPKTKQASSAIDNNLLNAVKSEDVEAVKTVLADKVNINGTSDNGSTVLMWACKIGKANIVKALVDAGANLNLSMSTGSSALAIAVKNNHVEVVKILLAAGAKVDNKSYELAIDRGNINLIIEFGRRNPKKQKTSTEFRETFGFLCESSEEKDLLEALSYVIDSIKKSTDGGLKVKIGDETIECEPAFKGTPNDWVPKSYAAIATHFNGISWESMGGGSVGFGGLNDHGDPEYDWGWDFSCLEEGGEERDDLEDAWPAFGCGQNWLLFDPVIKNKRGEAALGCVSHESCIWEQVDSANDLSYAGVLLRLMASCFISYNFDGVYL